MSQKYEKLKTLLEELFQLDQPDLDFGLYRVMHAKSAEVKQFLEKDLLPQVQAAFGQYKTADKVELEKELAKVIAGIEAAGMDPAQSPKVRELRERIHSDAVDLEALEGEVYDHLFGFFRRYYSEGDFLAKRVYRPGVYAIPYEGEEVTLHWANKDQYYIKTSEYLRDYAFRLRPNDAKNPMRVHFRLVDATEGEHGNVKAAEGKDRVFIPAAPGESGRDFIAEEDGDQGKELVIRFEYRPATLTDWPADARDAKSKPPAQKDLSALAVTRVLAVTDPAMAPWAAELGKPQVTASGEKTDYTRLEAHLRRYTARNTFDYFIHKDLGTFLRRELDFYIKNEVMHLDDVESESAPRVEQYLSKIKVIRSVANKITDFLTQLENFQKKLWLKKKFVVETQWCISVGTVPESFYAEILLNEAQHKEWVELLAINEIEADLTTPGYSAKLKPEFLKAHPTLLVDTRHFPAGFTARLLEAIGDLSEHADGLLLHGENSDALLLMQARYGEQLNCIYIDPPYNTGSDGFAYKDSYQHSSWLAMTESRLVLARQLLHSSGLFLASCDDHEYHRLRALTSAVFGDPNLLSPFVWKNKAGGGDDSTHIAAEHEYVVTAARHSPSLALSRMAHESPAMTAKYNKSENGRRFYLERLDKTSLTYSASMDFGIEAPDGTMVHPPQKDAANPTTIWRWGLSTIAERRSELIFQRDKSGEWRIYTKTWEPDERGVTPRSLLVETSHGRNREGTVELGNLFGPRLFRNPKPTALLEHLLRLSNAGDGGCILDYFAGSGTTGHAVIKLNRDDGGRRNFILVEMGDHFDTVLLPRIKKVVFTPEWKNGKPTRFATPEEAERSPRVVKVVCLESYEDALNNLETARTDKQQLLLNSPEARGAGGLREDYILRYMLDVETRGSRSLLDVQAFTDPTAYKLKVKRPGSDESREVTVDLLETFDWLIGLTVKHIAAPQTFSAAFERDSEGRLRLKGRLRQDAGGPFWFRTVTGTTPDGRRTLVIWRKLTGEVEQDNLVLDEWFAKQGYSAKDSEFDIIYVNGGNNLENLKTPDDLWKVRLIEEDFHRLMFEMEGA